MPSLLNHARFLSAVALSCAACGLDVTPDVGGESGTLASAGRAALLSSVSSEAPSWEPPRDAAAEQPTAGAGKVAGAGGAVGAAGKVADSAAGTAPVATADNPQAAGAMASAPSAKKAPTAGQMAAGAGAPAPKPAEQPAAGSAAPAAGSVSMPTSRCAPGRYVGTFAGTVQVLSLPVVGMTGTVVAELVANEADDALVIASSRIEGMADEQTTVTAKLVGTVDCATLELADGALKEGVLTMPGLLGESSTMTFSGKATATYSSAPAALKGMWQAAPDSALSGSGSWSVARASTGQ